MRAPVSWIREYVDLPAGVSTDDLAHRLTALGLKLEAIERAGGDITGPLVVGRVLTMEPEPQKNGKTINWCTVDVGTANGSGEPQGIVCGAHNFAPGDLVVVVLPGAVLPGGFEISERKTYGHLSAGMICSARELALGEDHDGIIVLPADAGAPGDDAFDVLGLREEVIEFEINPDRAYALSLRGVSAESLAGVSAEFAAGQITGIAGLTGSGRETLLGAVFGAIPRDGEVLTAAGTRIPPARPDLAMRYGLAFLPADRTANSAIPGLPARENIAVTHLRPLRRLWTVRRRAERREALTWFERLGVRPAEAVDRPLESFSGGNQQKILFGKWLRRRPDVLLLDEPTQGVDVGAKAVLHRRLVEAAAAGAAVVISSSDVDELAAICRRVLVCRQGRLAADLHGDDVTVRAISQECLQNEEAA